MTDRETDERRLADRTCEPCNARTPAVKGPELERMTAELAPRWSVAEASRLRATFDLPDFREALDLANRVGEIAEAEGHHPEICLTWGELRVTLWTHAIDALSENDFILAAKIDDLMATRDEGSPGNGKSSPEARGKEST